MTTQLKQPTLAMAALVTSPEVMCVLTIPLHTLYLITTLVQTLLPGFV